MSRFRFCLEAKFSDKRDQSARLSARFCRGLGFGNEASSRRQKIVLPICHLADFV